MSLWFPDLLLETALMISPNEVSCFTLAVTLFERKTWELKNASIEGEIKGKTGLLIVTMPDGVSLFFLGNASDKYQRQNEAYMINKSKIWSRKVIFGTADSVNKIPPTYI